MLFQRACDLVKVSLQHNIQSTYSPWINTTPPQQTATHTLIVYRGSVGAFSNISDLLHPMSCVRAPGTFDVLWLREADRYWSRNGLWIIPRTLIGHAHVLLALQSTSIFAFHSGVSLVCLCCFLSAWVFRSFFCQWKNSEKTNLFLVSLPPARRVVTPGNYRPSLGCIDKNVIVWSQFLMQVA